MNTAYLILSNGQVFPGARFGAEGSALGELVFTTNMCGYIETLTDPSYFGQIVMHTFPLIGNYGVIEEDFEGECALSGYVVREWCAAPSNFRSEYDLDTFLKQRNIIGLSGVDTRQVTRIIREHGVMNALITDELPADLSAIRGYAVANAVASVSQGEERLYTALGEHKYNVTLIDYGEKRNIVRELRQRGCAVRVVPYDTAAEAILARQPDGLVLSNGPGDPADNPACINGLKKLVGKLPVFGICLGHQLLALAQGGSTFKLKYGHRGANQPARAVDGSRTYITSQNHGYAVAPESLPYGQVSFVNANDNTCEGLDYPESRAFSVQFHPEACAGPHDTSFLFDKFIALLGGAR